MSGRRPYRRELSKTSWFLTNSRYKTYMLHEVSSIFVAIYMLVLIIGLFCLGNGPEAWASWLAAMRHPVMLLFSFVAFAFFLIHTISWFKAVPQATRIMRGEDIVPGSILVGAHYAIFGVVSLFVLGLAIAG